MVEDRGGDAAGEQEPEEGEAGGVRLAADAGVEPGGRFLLHEPPPAGRDGCPGGDHLAAVPHEGRVPRCVAAERGACGRVLQSRADEVAVACGDDRPLSVDDHAERVGATSQLLAVGLELARVRAEVGHEDGHGPVELQHRDPDRDDRLPIHLHHGGHTGLAPEQCGPQRRVPGVGRRGDVADDGEALSPQVGEDGAVVEEATLLVQELTEGVGVRVRVRRELERPRRPEVEDLLGGEQQVLVRQVRHGPLLADRPVAQGPLGGGVRGVHEPQPEGSEGEQQDQAQYQRRPALAVPHGGSSPVPFRRPRASGLEVGVVYRPRPADGGGSVADGTVVASPVAGTVSAVPVAADTSVSAGDALVFVEIMKMEQQVAAPHAGRVAEVLVAVGDVVEAGDPLVRLTAGTEADAPRAEVPGGTGDPGDGRADLATLRERRAKLADGARPDAVARRHDRGYRTARENVAAVVDDGSFVEYGGLAIAAQRRRRSIEELLDATPADGLITGIGTVHADRLGPERSRVAVLAYDYTVLAGTQGMTNHAKLDRMLELCEELSLPLVIFAEGGGGRPGDTDALGASWLDVTSFRAFARLSGEVPIVAIVQGRCFAGNAALAGCADVLIATPDARIGMAGPAMIEGGGLGRVEPDDIGPAAMHAATGAVDVVVADESEAAATARAYLGYFQGVTGDWTAADQEPLRAAVPENRKRVYDVRAVLDRLADEGSVLELRRDAAPGMVTALARFEGRPVGVVANDPTHLGGAIDAAGADSAARLLGLCDAHRLPVVVLCDTPGFMVGPEAEEEAGVRRFGRLFLAGANLTVPLVAVVLRKAYGLGAQAMLGGHLRAPVATFGWPTAELGPMGLEGAVRLGFRRELDAVEDPDERAER
ncbi:MAG: biotin/lipoyl-binding protein, partial [Actinobacteria bacterium]|nr:biotin/lipoyl-binding protein [Actinomycetota bacterium]